jgi:hypothetical protein
MGAVNQSVSANVYAELQTARDKASRESEDTRWSLEYNIDKAVAGVLNAAGIRGAIEAAVKQVLNDFKTRHP